MFKIYDGREQFFQWDSDRKLIVEDPTITEVHFCNRTDDCSLVCETYVEDGVTLVNVPNILLQTDWRIHVYAVDSNYTKYNKYFEVVSRTKPADYIYTETEVLSLDALNKRVEAVEKTGGVPDAEKRVAYAEEAGSANYANTAGMADSASRAENATFSDNASYANWADIAGNADFATFDDWGNEIVSTYAKQEDFEAVEETVQSIVDGYTTVGWADNANHADMALFDENGKEIHLTYATKAELGEVETALDSIIAIQNALIGGVAE